MIKTGRIYLAFIIMLSMMTSVFGAKVEVKLINKHPVRNEQFSVEFKVTVEGNEEAYISFDPVGVEVQGRRNQGLSIQTSYINGKLITKKERIYSYDLIASKEGVAWLKNIEVDLGGEVIKHPNVRIRIFTFSRANRQVFVQAEMAKKNLYIGEGVDVKYFLYYRVPVIASEIKKFPTFNNFLKRDFLKEKQESRVNYGGKVYEKHLVYSVRLYPEKAGNLYIDPIQLNIVYESRSTGFPFGSSPFFGGQRYSKSLVSEKIKINVLPLPENGFPGNFTGLVGKHDFKITTNKSKFLVNEAIELKFEAKGPGALEKLELPEIYIHPELEEFNTTSDLNIGARPPFKKIDYTFLGRSNFKIPEREVKLYYFDPDKKDYVGTKVKIPALLVAGGNYAVQGKKDMDKGIEESAFPNESRIKNTGMIAPLFSKNSFSFSHINWVRMGTYALGIITLILLVEMLLSSLISFGGQKSEADILYREIKKNGLSYSKLYSLLLLLFRDKKVLDLSEELEQCSLPRDVKDYFVELLNSLERNKFSSGNNENGGEKVNRSMFNNLLKIINENNKISTGN